MKYRPIPKKKVEVVAINVSPIKIDCTPENVVKKSQVHRIQRKKNGKIEISDFNPFDLIESTDTSKGMRDSHQTRGSRSCMPSPTRDPLEVQFRDTEDDHLGLRHEILSDNRRKEANRYSLIDMDDSYLEDMEEVRDSISELNPQLQAEDFIDSKKDQVRRSKSYDKHELYVPTATAIKLGLPPSGPQYEVHQGGNVKTQKICTPQKKQISGGGTIAPNQISGIKRSNSSYKIGGKFESKYSKSGKNCRKIIDVHEKLKAPQPKQQNFIGKFSSFKKSNGSNQKCLTSQGDEDSRSSKPKKPSMISKKALTTGYKTSEGTEVSQPQSPQSTKFQEFAQTAYTFEMQNMMKNNGTHQTQINHTNQFESQIHYQNYTQMDMPQFEVRINSQLSQNPSSIMLRHQVSSVLSNQPSRKNLVNERLMGMRVQNPSKVTLKETSSVISTPGTGKRRFLDNQQKLANKNEIQQQLLPKINTPGNSKTQQHQYQIDLLKQKIINLEGRAKALKGVQLQSDRSKREIGLFTTKK